MSAVPERIVTDAASCGATVAVRGDVADDVVARGEQDGAAERVERARSRGSAPGGRARRRARARPRRSAPRRRRSGSCAGSPSAMIAIVTAISGAAPAITDARAGPASRTPSTNRSCAPPGASSPASTNGQSSPPHSRPIARDDRADAEPARARSRTRRPGRRGSAASRSRGRRTCRRRAGQRRVRSATPDTRPNLTG